MVRGYRRVTSCYDLDLTFDHTVITLTLESYPGNILEVVRSTKLICGRDMFWGCRCAMSWCYLDFCPLSLPY